MKPSLLVLSAVLACVPGAARAEVQLYAMSVTEQRLMAVERDPVLFREIGPVGTFIQDIAFRAADGFLYGYDFQDQQRLLRIDPADATTTAIGAPITDFGWENAQGMAYDPCGNRLYATLAGSNELLSIDPANGVPALVGVMDSRTWGLTYVPEDEALYGVTIFDRTLVCVDPSDASMESIGRTGGVGGAVEGLAFDPTDGLLYAVVLHPPQHSESMLVTIDRRTGEVSELGPIATDDFISGLAFAAACPADVDGSGDVGFDDLLAILAGWGPCRACAEDIDGDGTVGFTDLLVALSTWGRCPGACPP